MMPLQSVPLIILIFLYDLMMNSNSGMNALIMMIPLIKLTVHLWGIIMVKFPMDYWRLLPIISLPAVLMDCHIRMLMIDHIISPTMR